MADSEQPATEEVVADSQTIARDMEDKLTEQFTGAESEAKEEKTETGEAEPEGDGLEDVEWEGEQYRLPKKLKEGLLRQSDYTKKTQDLARQREAIDLQLQGLKRDQLERAFMDDIKDETKRFHRASAEIEQYEALDWTQLDTEQMLRARTKLDQLQREQGKAAQAIEGKRGEFVKKQEQLMSELVHKGQEVLRSRISGWNESLAKSVQDYAIGEGYSPEEVRSIIEPRYVQTLWKAQQYDKLVANKAKVTAIAQGTTKVVKPGASHPMPQAVKDKLAFRKAVKSANTSSAKARVIEDQLAAGFDSRRR